MKKIQILATIGVIALTSALLSFVGASADEKKSSSESNSQSNNSIEEFKGSGTRSHGHPVANLVDTPNAGSKQNSDAWVSDDDQNSEINWQKWNKANETSDKKSMGNAKTIGSNASSPITFHNGGVIGVYSGPVQIIPVWVGAWSDATRKAKWNSVLGNLVSSLGGVGDIATPNHLFTTNALYFTSKNAVTSKLTWTALNSQASIPANLRKASSGIVPVTDADVATYINRALTSKVVAAPISGTRPIYVYIGGADTRLSSGFGTYYCGWHTYGTLGAKNIPYIAVQDFTATYAKSCAAQTVSPNGDYQLDAVASILVHEIDEAITSPDLRTWYDNRGAENADKCAWTFGITSLVGMAKYNFTTTNYKYLIQRNWLADNKVADPIAGTACVVTSPK